MTGVHTVRAGRRIHATMHPPSHLEGEDHDEHHDHAGEQHGSVEPQHLTHHLGQRHLDPK